MVHLKSHIYVTQTQSSAVAVKSYQFILKSKKNQEMILRNHFFVCTETDDEKQDINTAVIPMEEKKMKWNVSSRYIPPSC